MRAAIIGVGDIARKAYLPVLCADPRLTPVLVTRSAAVRDDVARAWRIDDTFASVTDAVRAGIDVAFVHAATVAHAEILDELIAAGVHVYVDKPIDDSAAGAARLAEAARTAGVSLAVGFNRRFAPEYTALGAWTDRDTVILGKHRFATPSPRASEVAAGRIDDDRSLIFDDFIHVLDTLRFLGAEGVDGVDVSARREDGRLRRIEVVLRDGHRRATGLMDRDSGATTEELDVFAPGRRARVRDLAEVTDYAGGSVTVRHRQEWTSVAHQRGFTGAVNAFLDAVTAGQVLDATDAVRTHVLCEEVVEQLGRI